MKGKKFIASYSGGKDSTLAIYKAINLGMIPLTFITTYNTDRDYSWTHGIPETTMADISHSINIPILLIKTTTNEYAKDFEKALSEQKEAGAEVCVFGDIDIEGHFEWCSQRCKNAGLEAFFPLWKRNRKDVVFEFIENGFQTYITVIDTERMNINHLGKILTKERAELISAEGADICGENGEYHTFVSDGPIFKNKLCVNFGEQIIKGKYAILPIENSFCEK